MLFEILTFVNTDNSVNWPASVFPAIQYPDYLPTIESQYILYCQVFF